MCNRILYVFFVFLSCIGHQSIFAQVPVNNFQKTIDKYRNQKQTEKVYVHTDKDLYLAGEIIWFKLYYVDGSFHKPFDLSKIAYVEILDRENKAVAQAKIELVQGSGNGSVALPLATNSGVYRLRAYTQWMKNGGAEHFFEKQLTCVNTLKPLEQKMPETKQYNVSFFPEGGNLVQDIPSKLAFQIVDRYGKGVVCKGTIVNQNNDSIASFAPLKFGIGHFIFTPKSRDSYRARIQVDDTLIEATLPPTQPSGFVMNMSMGADSGIHIQVRSNSTNPEEVLLLIRNRDVVKMNERRILVNGIVEFVVDKNKLGEGVSQVTAFNKLLQPLCERLYFIRPTQKIVINADLNAAQFSSRKKVEIKLVSKDEMGRPLPAEFSTAVYKIARNPSETSTDISSYLWLCSELRGNIESPEFYFSDSMDVAEATDNLMLTHGWRRFLWKDILSDKTDTPRFLPEYKDHIVHAKITNVKTGMPAARVLTYLAVPGKRVQLYSSMSDSTGILKFYTTDLYGPSEIMLLTDKGADSSYKIELTSPFPDSYLASPVAQFHLPQQFEELLMDNTISMQVQNIFSGDKLAQLLSPQIDSNAFFGPPDNSYFLDNFVRFSTMEEVLREYITEVLVRRQKENFRLMIAGGIENRIFLDDPLTLFNGVPVFETNKLMQYDPLKIEKIEVVKRRYFYGSSTLNGIVNFITYQPDPELLSGLNAVVFDYEGIQYERQFYSPVYETVEQLSSKLPDFRNLLYWSPTIKAGVDGKAALDFYTSDTKGNFVVVIQGMNADGRAGMHSFNFAVK